jgi:transcriptional regulator with XRE-family HTH domain
MKEKTEKILKRINLCKKTDNMSEFAGIVGLPSQTVDNYLSKRRKLSLQFLMSVCENFHVSADWLLGFTDSRTGTSAPATDAATLAKIAALEAEIAAIKAEKDAEIARLNGENQGLRFALESLGKAK